MQVEIPPPKSTTLVPEMNILKWFKEFSKPPQNSFKETMDLELSAPTHWTLGDVQPLSILLLPETKTLDSRKGQLKLEIRLLSVEHTITARTLVRIPGREKFSEDGAVEIVSNGMNDEIQTCFVFKTVSPRKEIRRLEEGKRLDLGKELEVMVPRKYLPGFESYNISLVHSSSVVGRNRS